jgi:hypothetical protein
MSAGSDSFSRYDGSRSEAINLDALPPSSAITTPTPPTDAELEQIAAYLRVPTPDQMAWLARVELVRRGMR